MPTFCVSSGELNRTVSARTPEQAALKAIKQADPQAKLGVITSIRRQDRIDQQWFVSTENALSKLRINAAVSEFRAVINRRIIYPYKRRHRFYRAPGEEVWATYYYQVILDLLAVNGGVITQQQAEQAIERLAGRNFGPQEMRLVNNRPKWKNQLDWAKARLAKEGLVYTRQVTIDGKKHSFMVQRASAPRAWVTWAAAKPKHNRFTKKCHDCGLYNRLSEHQCVKCGWVFPPTSPKAKVMPK